MSLVEKGGTHPRGEALLEELVFVHGLIRRNLGTISALAEQVEAGAPAERLRTRLDELASTSLLWRLRKGCMRYCFSVHHHHEFEDAAWFPALRVLDPELHPVVDRLEADHAAVSGYLNTVEEAARRLAGDESARADVSAALKRLSGHLISHLDYEEASLGSTLRSVRSWPLDF